ncbi:MAG: NUDIX hydrolase [Hyphomonadaceae bacterium]
MTRPFDPDDDPAQAGATNAAKNLNEGDLFHEDPANFIANPVSPRDAATLILYRLDDDRPRILMGCRASGHDFMPDKYVFPGGRVDDEDATAPAMSELAPEVAQQLRYQSERHPRIFPLTAIREMFEETGLIVGNRSPPLLATPPAWAGYYGQGAAPSLAGFSFVGRAVTPPMRHKRFDARFFMADAAQSLIDDRPPADSRELADLRWFTLAEAAELDLPNITRYVISEVEAQLIKRQKLRPFFLRWSEQGHVSERI